MKYLDAKKRLIYMMATLKYIRLLFKDEIIVTDDELKLLVKKSVPLIFKDYIIRTEDINEIVGGIKSCIIRFNKEKVSVKDSLSMETLIRGRLKIDDTINLSDAIKLVTIIVNTLNLNNNKILLEDNINIKPDETKVIKNENIPIKLSDEFDTLIAEAVHIVLKDKIKVEDELLIKDGIKSILLSINNKSNLKDRVAMELLYQEVLKIDDKLFINELVEVIKASSLPFKNKTENITLKNNVNVLDSISDVIRVDGRTSLLDSNELVSLYSDLVKINDLILTNNYVSLKDIQTSLVKINSKVEVSSYVDIFISHFLSLPMEISTKLNISDNLNIDKDKTSSFKIDENLNITDVNNLLDDESKLLNGSYTMSIKDYLGIKRFRYSLLKDIDPYDMDNLLNLNMSQIIYVEKD